MVAQQILTIQMGMITLIKLELLSFCEVNCATKRMYGEPELTFV